MTFPATSMSFMGSPSLRPRSVSHANAGNDLGITPPPAAIEANPSVAPVGIILGRIGCLLHGCCLGAVCEQPAWWTLADSHGHPRWPAVPAEIAFNVAALVAFAVLRARRLLPGQHFHLYLIGYGAFRFVHEFWRDTPRVALGLSGYQFASLALVGFAVWHFRQRARATTATPR